MKIFDEKTGHYYYAYTGEAIPRMEDILSPEKLKQLEEDELLDGKPGTIPNWSVCYKGNKKNKIDNNI
ncbi:MAG: hypothetical protein LUH02_03435 [Erysipelotrichaceae bacterium]|nr:hypothetical protein [Erysipelotrichaceae bacterium]